MVKMVKSFVKDEQGLETVEYAVMTALIVAAVVVAIGFLAGAVTTRFGAVQGVIDGIQTSSRIWLWQRKSKAVHDEYDAIMGT